jgi:preprotein translocase SecE subunit
MGLLGLSPQTTEPKPGPASPADIKSFFRLNIYKRGQGNPIRISVFIAFGLLWLSGCHWIYLLPNTESGWYKSIFMTGGSLLAFALVAVAGLVLYRSIVRGREDRGVLRWAAMTGGVLVSAAVSKWLMLDVVLASVDELARPLYSAPLPVNWGNLISAALFAYGLWSIYHLIVNHPQRVDFLIETETELRKMAWPTRREYLGASMVVIVIVAMISLYLTAVDMLLHKIMVWLKIGF